jgi:hypothetical protein
MINTFPPGCRLGCEARRHFQVKLHKRYLRLPRAHVLPPLPNARRETHRQFLRDLLSMFVILPRTARAHEFTITFPAARNPANGGCPLSPRRPPWHVFSIFLGFLGFPFFPLKLP